MEEALWHRDDEVIYLFEQVILRITLCSLSGRFPGNERGFWEGCCPRTTSWGSIRHLRRIYEWVHPSHGLMDIAVMYYEARDTHQVNRKSEVQSDILFSYRQNLPQTWWQWTAHFGPSNVAMQCSCSKNSLSQTRLSNITFRLVKSNGRTSFNEWIWIRSMDLW